jgi:hypothetical protein
LATKLRWNSNRNWFNNEAHEPSSKHLLVLRTTAGQQHIDESPRNTGAGHLALSPNPMLVVCSETDYGNTIPERLFGCVAAHGLRQGRRDRGEDAKKLTDNLVFVVDSEKHLAIQVSMNRRGDGLCLGFFDFGLFCPRWRYRPLRLEPVRMTCP